MNQQQFKQKIEEAGRLLRNQLMITLIDGARHIVDPSTIDDSGDDLVTYHEIHSMSTAHRMAVPYRRIEDVVDLGMFDTSMYHPPQE